MKYFKLLLIASLLILINSCKDEEKPVDSTNYRDYTPEIIQEEYGRARVVGFVKGKDGNPLEGVRVYFGEHESITDGQGKFELIQVSEGSKKRIWFEKDGFAKTQKLIDVREYLPNRVDAALFPITETVKMSDEGGLIEGDDFSVEIQSGGFVYSDGEIVAGEVTVSATPFLTSKDNFIEAFPGDFEGRRENGSITAIESLGFIDVDLHDKNGEPVQLAEGVTATIKIKAPQNAPESIPMWYYDYSKAEWIEEGIGTLDNGFYTAEVTHFTPWNWDLPIDLLSTIVGRIIDSEGKPIEGAKVIQRGKNREILESVLTNYQGWFKLFTLENIEVELEAQFDIYESTILNYTTLPEPASINNVELIINIDQSNILPPYTISDTIYITKNKLANIAGNYFGNEKREDYKLFLNNEEIETELWSKYWITFNVPNNIPEFGKIIIDRGGSIKELDYIEGIWECEIGDSSYSFDSRYLYLQSKTIAELPPCIGNFDRLAGLYLSSKDLTTLPIEFTKLSNLVELHINGNQLIDLPVNFGNLTNLTVLLLQGNQLTSLPESFGNLINLEELYLSGNKIKEFPESMRNLDRLIYLSLNNMDLTEVPNWVGDLDNLGVLGLSSNNITEFPKIFLEVPRFGHLYLNNNKIRSLPTDIDKLIYVRELYLGSNGLEALPENFGVMNGLTRLELATNNLNRLPDSFGNLKDLKILNLGNNNISELPDSIGSLESIIEITLSGNQLNKFPESIKNLANTLEYLYIGGNQFSEVEKAKIEAWLPNTDIYW